MSWQRVVGVVAAVVVAMAAACDGATASAQAGMDAGSGTGPDGATYAIDTAPDATPVADASVNPTDALPDSQSSPDDSNWYTQATCYGFGVDGGTSHVYQGETSVPGCTLWVDDAGANPSVWCCPFADGG